MKWQVEDYMVVGMISLALLWGLIYLVRLLILMLTKCQHRWIADPQITVLCCAYCPAMISYEKGTYEMSNKLLKRHYAKR